MPSAKGALKAVFNPESGITLRKDGLAALADFLAQCADAEHTATQLLEAAQRGVLLGKGSLCCVCESATACWPPKRGHACYIALAAL